MQIKKALEIFESNLFPVVLIEMDSNSTDALAIIQHWRNHTNIEKRATAFILQSAKAISTSNSNLVKELGDVDIVTKPFNQAQMLGIVSRVFGRRQKLFSFHLFRDKILCEYQSTKEFTAPANKVKKSLMEFGPKGIELLCELYELSGNVEIASQLVDAMLVKDMGNPFFLAAKGRLLMQLGQYNDARERFEKANSISPHYLKRLEDMEEVYLRLKQPDKAVTIMKERLTYSISNDVKFLMAEKLQNFGFEKEAQDFCKQATSPLEVVRYYNNRGVALSKVGNIDEAIKEYQKAIVYFPDSPENARIYFNMALALAKIKTKEKILAAILNLNKCLALAPQFDKAKLTRDQLKKNLQTLV